MISPDEIADNFYDEKILKADGLDSACIGYLYGGSPKLVYSVSKILFILIERDGMTMEEAREFFDFNIGGAYMGEGTPIFVHTE